ncbi:acetamidase/formamidase family protein [Sphingomonas sp. MMS24-J13]|uniref:acetamidase/formamidase family protein n=1 Tax=Sphingomonas sp. MMS24-J13 TaxID=3238686 RepID=UPI00385172CB
MKNLMILAALLGTAASAGTYDLPASPTTVAWGHYDPKAKPVLTIKSGDRVVMHTLITSSPDRLEGAGVAPKDVEQSLRDITAHVTDKGPGGHILTGPIAIEGAEPGDTLEIRIEKIDLAIPYAYNAFRYGAGFLTDDFPYARMKIVPLDRTQMVAHFAPGITIPLHPFFGSMGIAPPPDFGRYDSTAPTIIGGNMDNKDLIAGSTLYLPVHVPGALFEAGDGHAAQGNGEVDITALETSLTGTFRFILHKKGELPGPAYPRAETPTHYIAMGFDDDLSNATRKALRNMIDYLVAAKGMNRDDAYMLLSAAGDVAVTELVDRNKGVHVLVPKALFAK